MDHPRASVSGDLGVLILNKPSYNLLSKEFFEELHCRFSELLANQQVKAIVVTTTGNVFSTGFDVRQIRSLAESQDRALAEAEIWRMHEILLSLERSSKPTIAAVNGICLGGGLELSLACQYRIGVIEGLIFRQVVLRMAKLPNPIGLPEIELGLIPGLGGTQRLPRLVGVKNAMKILLSGKQGVSFADAHQLGLFDRLASRDLVQETKSFAAEILTKPIQRTLPEDHELDLSDFKDNVLFQLAEGRSVAAVDALVTAVREGMDLSLERALKEVELSQFLDCAFSPDGREGLAAFFEKRFPKFSQAIHINSPR